MIESLAGTRGPTPKAAQSVPPRRSARWLVGFVVLHLACQLLLLVPGLSSVRVLIRVMAFGLSLAFLVLIPSRNPPRLAVKTCAGFIVAVLCLEFFHPEGSGLLAALASVMLNLAVLAPVFWVPRTEPTPLDLQRLVTMLWLYYTASAVLGVLQAYFPGSFQPPLSAVLASNGMDRLAALQIQLASGERVFRPMGLTDSPGGAAFGGLYSVLLGTGIILSPKPAFFGARIAAVGSMIAGLMCLYLCEVRSLVVMTGVCVITMLVLLLLSGRISRLVGLFTVVGAAIPSAFTLALTIGGRAMTDRLSTLVEADPGTVYYSNRGRFFEATLYRYLPLYPLGAGLGRWGMVHAYFGNAMDALWVEIQWTGWLFDGGLPMMCLYLAAIIISSWSCLKIALGHVGSAEPTLSLWGAVLVSYNVGALAVCFNYALFGGTGGVEFWLLNMTLICAAHNVERAAPRARLA